MTAFPRGTKAKDIGAKIGDKFRLCYDFDHRVFKKDDILVLKEDDNTICPFFSLEGRDEQYSMLWHYLEPICPTWETLKLGDVLEHKTKLSRIVKGTMEDIVFYTVDFDTNVAGMCSIAELKDDKWSIKTTQQPKKMTVSEVAKALGHEVEIVEG